MSEGTMESCVTTGEFRDRKLDEALATYYGQLRFERSIVDGQRGYTVTRPNGVKCFHYRLGTAIREMLKALGHGDDREVIVIGEPERGNCW